ncbi:hypothetical protein KEM54_001875 [Ascosphaera aggregata]|nr:hypothetical protein KEM54_001875 [Ascosphaera aggregata]
MVSHVDKVRVEGDPRIQKCQTFLNGTRYGYLLSVPKCGSYKGTIILVHGFPDLSMGWRYQIPFLRSLGYRVVAPDMVGYGRTDAPLWCPENEQKYSYKQITSDIKELARQLGSSQAILGGHDWGGVIVQRIALYEPEFASHIFTVCTPYTPPTKQYVHTADLVKLPQGKQFGYQLQLSSGEVEKKVQTPAQIRQALNAMYGGWLETDNGGGGAFATQKGILFDRIERVQPTPLLSEEVSFRSPYLYRIN